MRARAHVFTILIALSGFAALSDGAAAAGCEATPGAASFEVDVNVDVGEPEIYNQLSKAQLGSSNFHGKRAQILGTTQSGLELRWSINYQVREWRNVYCFWVANAEVEISYQTLDVNIASEYEPGSCQYEAILDHEYEHVEVAQEIMSPYSQRIRQALTSLSIPTSHLPSVANSPEIARAEVEEVFRRILSPVRDEMAQLLSERQAEVDTLDNYRRTWRSCREW